MPNDDHVLPLEGVKVLDFSTLLPGPMAGLILAEAGAGVLKIERPGSGEDMRNYPPRWGNDGVNFALLNGGKKSLAVDLKDAGQLELLRPLLEETDVLIEQFRPGVMDRLGLGYEALAKINPGIVYCSITGYGQTGPKAQVAGHDMNYIGDTGLLALSPGTRQSPTVPPVLAADLAGGSYPAVTNILLALLARQRTGRGSHLDIAMTDNLFMLMTWAMGLGLAGGDWPKPGAGPFTGGSPRYQIYPASDGRLVAAAPLEQKFWETFCDLIGLDEASRDDQANPQATTGVVAEIIAGRPAEHWGTLFAGQDCCCSVVAGLEDALADEHFKARGLFDLVLENGAGEHMPATPTCVVPQFRKPVSDVRRAPELGADNDELLARKPPQASSPIKS